jgi:predicted transcriptional regulator
MTRDGPDIEEDLRRLRAFERTGKAVPFEEVKAWVDSWGTANELPRPQARKLK